MHNIENFLKAVEVNAFNTQQRTLVHDSINRYTNALEQTREQYANLELAKERAAYYKWKVLESLDKYLIEFEANVQRKGGKVVWAIDAEAAITELDNIIKRSNAQQIVKSQTNVGNEIGLTAFLRSKGLDTTESLIGDYINDVAGESAFHPVNPVLQKSRADITALLNDKIGVSLEAESEEINSDIRNEIRDKFRSADIAITGANFLIAENGTVALTENEGNIRMSVSFAKTHVVIAGIDKIIPAMNDLDTYLPLLSTYGTGQKLTTYNSIVGPRLATETDGPLEFIVILLDNGRSNLLSQPEQRQTLSCIKCGACSNVCPVYKTIGGHAYQTTYNGPIGSVITPHLNGFDEFKHLSFASPLCGKSTAICPVKIDIDNHLLRNRRDSVQQGFVKNAEKLAWYSWKKMALSRKNMNKGAGIKNFMLKSFFKSSWGERREFPKVADKSFNQLWREKMGQK